MHSKMSELEAKRAEREIQREAAAAEREKKRKELQEARSLQLLQQKEARARMAAERTAEAERKDAERRLAVAASRSTTAAQVNRSTTKVINPLGSGDLDDESDEEAQTVVNTSGLNDDELSDIVYAFQACDYDGDGQIEPYELQAMIGALGGTIEANQLEPLIKAAKVAYTRWDVARGSATTPDLMLCGGDEPGQHGTTKHGGKRHYHKLQIDKKQQLRKQLPSVVASPLEKTIGAVNTFAGKHEIMSTTKSHSPSEQKIIQLTQTLVADAGDGTSERDVDAEENSSNLNYAEWVLMVTSGMFKQYCNGDWHKSCWKMRQLRGSFGAAIILKLCSLFDSLMIAQIRLTWMEKTMSMPPTWRWSFSHLTPTTG